MNKIPDSNKQFLKPWLVSGLLLIGLTSCVCENRPSEPKADRQLQVLAVNDVYNIEGTDGQQAGGMARLRTLRRQLSEPNEAVLMLHSGDFLFPSSMSSKYKGEQMVDMMNYLDGDGKAFDDRLYVTFGNHEFDKKALKYAPMIRSRIEQADFYWLGTNVQLKGEAQSQSEAYQKTLVPTHLTTINDIKVGLFSITTDMAVPEYADIDGDYLAVAKRSIQALKAQGAEVIIAVTHLRMSEDSELLKALGDQAPDVIFGGHEHNRQHVCVAQRCVIKADADVRSATIATIRVSAGGEVTVEHRYSLVNDTTITADPQVQQLSNQWIARYQREYCQAAKVPDGCLFEAFGKTSVALVAEEMAIRRFETNLGSYIAEQMIHAFDNVTLPNNKKVQVALINSGSLRLNQNIPAQAELNDWYLNGLFQYSTDLTVLEVSGKTLRAAINHQVEDWTGNGWWLQSAGISFVHDVDNQQVQSLKIINGDGSARLLDDNEQLVVVMSDYIANPAMGDQDGYTMFNLDNEIQYAEQAIELKAYLRQAINAKYLKGEAIAPTLPGRVECQSSQEPSPCLL